MRIRQILMAAFGSAALFTPALADDMASIDGHWISASPEAQGGIYATREFHIEGDRWSVVFLAFADEAASQPLFRINVTGAYVIGGLSATVEGAHEGIFPALQRDLTALSAAGVAMFAGMGCRVEKGVVKHLRDEGCGFLPPLMQAMGEYDLVALREDRLYFGDRSGDLTKTRPTALTPFPLVRE
ncbi:MAG: hypothetical protein KDK89_22315 [Alphaproteobacteria bacterium]|nr:hypothetical protein [Alphaproteobacteria bacterium]